MKRRPYKNQPGYVLLMFLVVLMGAGGLLLSEFSEGMLDAVESKKFEHNKRVLKEAKQALLQSAYNYPVTNDLGPGRLPCADTDNDGIPNCGSTFGRLPWAQPNLNLYDIRDADGERLWYAVSSAFRPQAAIINSDSSGTITLRDQSGNVIFDGSNSDAQYGIAALIIAPGVAIERNGILQDRSVANTDDPFDYTDDDDTDKDTDPGITAAANYLDLIVGTEDNAGFTNSTTDGFILGPVTDLTNDQFIVITAAEVIEMAEIATLQTYQTAINDFRVNTSYCEGEDNPEQLTKETCLADSGTWIIGPYPWLYNYTGVPDYAGLTSYYPANSSFATELATNLTTIGRIPTIFGDYFTETSGRQFETKLGGSISWNNSPLVGFNQLTEGGNPDIDSGDFQFFDGPTLDFQTAGKLTNVSFVDIADVVGLDGRLTGTMATPETFTYDVYYWEYDHSPFNGFWSLCAAGADELSDCNQDSSRNLTPGVENDQDLDIIHLVVTLDFSGVVNFDIDYTGSPVVIAPPVAASATSHASVTGTYDGAAIISLPFLSVTYERDPHYHEDNSALNPGDADFSTGTLDVDDFNKGPLTLAVRYYPELPDWAFDNDWHNSMILAYAEGYKPGGPQTCDPDGVDATDSCVELKLRLNNAPPVHPNKDKIAVLLNTGQHDWISGCDGELPNGATTELDCLAATTPGTWIIGPFCEDEDTPEKTTKATCEADNGTWMEDDATGDSPGDLTFLNQMEDWDRVLDTGNRELDYIMRYKYPGDPASSTPRMVPPGNDNLLILEES